MYGCHLKLQKETSCEHNGGILCFKHGGVLVAHQVDGVVRMRPYHNNLHVSSSLSLSLYLSADLPVYIYSHYKIQQKCQNKNL